MVADGTGMAALPCCTEGTWKRSAAPRVEWPVYPRRAEHNTIAEGGNRRWAETPSAESPALITAYWPKTAATGSAGQRLVVQRLLWLAGRLPLGAGGADTFVIAACPADKSLGVEVVGETEGLDVVLAEEVRKSDLPIKEEMAVAAL